ncbi:MAG: glycosyltransferase family 39 protein [Chitinophagales bacterium]|nr:glycosyltransferase family 39 protein [Chitinophagales bacterium]
MEFFLRHKIILLFVFGLMIRIFTANFYLPFYNQDELTILYDAKSIVETGQDRWETPTHLFYRSLGEGEYRPPLMIWLQTIGYYFFGIQEFGARMISVIFGLMGIFCSYHIIRFLISKELALIYLFTMIFCPAHILCTSMAFESASLSSSILLIALYFAVRTYRENKISLSILAGFFLSLSVYTYPSMKLVSPLFGILILMILLKAKKTKIAFYFSLSAFVFILPQIWLFIHYPTEFMARASVNVPMRRKVIDYIFRIIETPFYSLFDISLWFVKFVKQHHNINITYLLVQLPFYLYGVLSWSKEIISKTKWAILLLVSFILSTTPEMATFAHSNIFRNPLLIYLIGFLISYGLYTLNFFKKSYWIAFGINFIFLFIFSYFQDSRQPNFQQELVGAYSKLSKYHKKYDKVVLQRYGNQPYVYLLYYGQVSPKYFQNSTIVNILNSDQFDDMRQIGKFHFVDKEMIRDSLQTLGHGLLVTELDLKLPRIDSSAPFKFYSY